MKRKILYSMMLAVLVTLGASKASRACGNVGGGSGPVVCPVYLGTICDGTCQGDVCPSGEQYAEYECSDGSIQYTPE
jgi:hypothetical protein